MEGHTEVVEILLEGGANVNLKGNNDQFILQGLIKCREMPEDKMVAIFKVLLGNGAEVQHAILTTIERGCVEVLKLLLQKGDLWINEKHGIWGQYPLMVAAQNNSIEMVKLLLKAGARTDVQDIVENHL